MKKVAFGQLRQKTRQTSFADTCVTTTTSHAPTSLADNRVIYKQPLLFPDSAYKPPLVVHDEKSPSVLVYDNMKESPFIFVDTHNKAPPLTVDSSKELGATSGMHRSNLPSMCSSIPYTAEFIEDAMQARGDSGKLMSGNDAVNSSNSVADGMLISVQTTTNHIATNTYEEPSRVPGYTSHNNSKD
ncbi:expressed unknown protein [Seminavis robusta]|uniref:Uncharacterized protein n=1 Tax=Seminavis robusta TaxID=568900 RepID=A0A9N8F2U5_9STRA|nr:expressed unknown protein [Seminavis robusta]|eukprot:Sro3150_g344480.1 n/a (186) ;mRNA; f:2013-2570